MYIKRGWLMGFVLDVPVRIRRCLLNLGLPVAGMHYEVRDGEVVFNEVLRVTKDCRFYWNNKRLTTREFVNRASLLTYYYEHIVDEFARFIDLRHARVVNGVDVRIGNYIVRKALSSEFMSFIYAYNIEIRRGFPAKKIPDNVLIVRDRDVTVIVIKDGPLSVKVSFDDDTNYTDVGLYYRGLYLGAPASTALLDYAIDGAPVGELVRVAREEYFARFVVEKRDGYRRIYYDDGSPVNAVYEFKNAAIRWFFNGPEKPEEIYGSLDSMLMMNGWSFFLENDHKQYYRKRVGPITMYKDMGKKWIGVKFANGLYAFLKDNGLLRMGDLWGYLEILPLL